MSSAVRNLDAIDPVRACIEKRRYGCEKEALAVAADCFAKRGTWLRVYACECGGYHLTKTDARPPAHVNWRPPAKSRRASRERERRRKGRRR